MDGKRHLEDEICHPKHWCWVEVGNICSQIFSGQCRSAVCILCKLKQLMKMTNIMNTRKRINKYVLESFHITTKTHEPSLTLSGETVRQCMAVVEKMDCCVLMLARLCVRHWVSLARDAALLIDTGWVLAAVDACVSKDFRFTTSSCKKPAAAKSHQTRYFLMCSLSADYVNVSPSTCVAFRALTGYFYFHLSVCFPWWLSAYRQSGEAVKEQWNSGKEEGFLLTRQGGGP